MRYLFVLLICIICGTISAHNITIKTSKHGVVNSDYIEAEEGQMITLQIQPEYGYILDKISGEATIAPKATYTEQAPIVERGSNYTYNQLCKYYKNSWWLFFGTEKSSHYYAIRRGNALTLEHNRTMEFMNTTIWKCVRKGISPDLFVPADSIKEDVIITRVDKNTYTFIMPDGDVVIDTSFLDDPYMVKSIEIGVSEIVLNAGEITTLSYTLYPNNVQEKTVIWSSNNTVIAEVNESGMLTAKKAGKCAITIKAQSNPNAKATCEVTVIQPVESITLNESSVTMTQLGEMKQLTANVQPGDASNKAVSWMSSNTGVCTVSTNGTVVATGYGKAMIVATTVDGGLPASCVVSVVKPSQPITLTAKNYNKVYGDENPTFGFTIAGEDLEGTPQITCDATKTSPVGTYPIVIKKGSVTNDQVTYVNGMLTITKAPLTISAGNYAKRQGEANPAFKATYEGFKNGETESVLTVKPMLGTTVSASTAPGEYEVTVSGAEAKNYDISYVKGKLTVNQAEAVTITADNKTIAYGDAIPELTFSVNGAGLSGSPQISCAATPSSPVGTYPIVIKKGSVANYNDTYVNGTLTITKAPLIISAGNYAKRQGEANPAFKATYEGFKNGETESVLTVKPMLSTTVSASTAPGEYDVTVSGAEATNYNISYVKGKLIVNQAEAVTITADNKTIVYGEAIPELTFSVNGAELSGSPQISCAATSSSPVGTYPIVVKKGSVANYNDTYVNGTLTIAKAPLTISAGNYSKRQGEVNPTFKATYKGFKNGETESVLTVKPKFSTTVNASTAPGEYDVTVSGAEAKNYDISYVKGKLTVTSATAVIITADDKTITYGEAIPELTYSVDGATLVGTPEITCDVTATSPVGTYPIVIKKGSVTNYNDTYINGTLTITKAPLTISAGNYAKRQGEANPAFKATYEGFKNGETESVLTVKPTITTTADETTAPGKYDVTVGGAEAKNYEISYVQGKLTVNAAESVTVTADNKTITYGDAIPQLTYKVSGATLNGMPEITCEATSESPVGTYPIIIKRGSVTNYNDTYVSGTLTIVKAPLTISAGNYSKRQGEVNPTFKATYKGFKNGETESVLTIKPKISTTVNMSTVPGKYDVLVSGAEAQNYDISYVQGTLTVTSVAAVIVTADDKTITYGENIPDLTYSVNGAALNGTPEIYCEATSTSPVGTYPIVVKRGSVTNPNDTYINGTLTIEKASQTLTWEQEFSDISQYDQVELLAVASSGLEVTYAIEGDPICEIVKIGDKQYIDCKSDGMTIIVAMQEGSNNYWATTKMYKPVLIKSATGINALEKGVDGDVRIFDASGHRLRKLQKGVNILKLSDGTTRKVFLK